MKAGRKSLLKVELQDKIVAQIKAGLGVKASARAIRLPIPTLFRWLARGRSENGGPYRELYLAVQSALAHVRKVA